MIAGSTKRKIISYYDDSWFDYHLFWRLGSQHALHYGFWDNRTHSLSRALRRENETLAQLAHITHSDHVLDAGCGVGGSSLYLAQTLGCKVTGISLVSSQIAAATSLAKKLRVDTLTHFKVDDFTGTSFPNNSFDVVWAIESVCHAPKKEDFLYEAYRLLKPGGRFIVAEYLLRQQPTSSHDQKIIRRWTSGWAIESLDTADAFLSKARTAGFADVRLQDFTWAIMPSSRHMYRSRLLTLPFEWITRKLGWRGKSAKGNFDAARYQYYAFRDNLCQYAVVTASKPRR